MRNRKIPEIVVERLPLYYRCLQKLEDQGVEFISSKKLGSRLGIHQAQVRKDLSYYGQFGKRGVGYRVFNLLKCLEEILGLNHNWEIALVGMGNLGQALINYNGFQKLGLNIKYVFDIDSDKIENKLEDTQIYNIKRLTEIIKENQVKIGILTVPAKYAQKIADKLIAAGIRTIWNFTPTYLQVPKDIKVRNEDLSIGLISSTYHLSN